MSTDLSDLSGTTYERTRLRDATFTWIDLADARISHAGIRGVRLRGVELENVEIDGELRDVVINGVDVAPLIEAELARRDPDYALMAPRDAEGFRLAWEILERRWSETVDRARDLDEALLHERVDGEWSFIETLRHLVFATDSWIGRTILGDPSPWDSLDLPWDEMPDTPGVPRDRDARPSLDAVLELRRDRMSTVREVIERLTDESLDGHTEPVNGPGWPESRSYPVRECLLIILSEEWEHRLYAERDLDALEARTAVAHHAKRA